MIALALLLGVLADQVFGDPRRRHPLALFGRLASRLERRLNRYPERPRAGRAVGLLALLVMVAPPVALAAWLHASPIGIAIDVLLLWFAIGARSLEQHAERVRSALQQGRLSQARQRVSWLVSRDTAAMDATDVARATTESVLENGNDAVFAPLFWFLLAGGPGVLAFRLVNTLDAMWGYRTPQYRHFGWAAARLDDLLGWLPARLTATSYAILGRTGEALRCWRRQAHQLDSPNAGPVMVSGAGALNVCLGGPASYHGAIKHKPWFGSGDAPTANDIRRATELVRHTLWLWVATALAISLAGALSFA